MSPESEEVREEKAVQTAATPPAAEVAPPTEEALSSPSPEEPLPRIKLPKEYQHLPPEEQERIWRRFQNVAAAIAAKETPNTSPPKDPAEEIRTVEDLERWAEQVGYRNIQREIRAFGVLVVLAKVVAFEQAIRHGEIRAHNKAGYFNWMLRQ